MKYLAHVKNIEKIEKFYKELGLVIQDLQIYFKKYFPEDGTWEFDAEQADISAIKRLVLILKPALSDLYAPQIEIFEYEGEIKKVPEVRRE